MKVLTTLIIVVVAAIVYAAGAVLKSSDSVEYAIYCPVINEENATLIPNPDDCNTYYTCETGIPILMKCPTGLHFNAKEEACDWPSQACCERGLNPNKCFN